MSLLITILESGSDVIISGSGSINTASLTAFGSTTINGRVQPINGYCQVGSGSSSSVDIYQFLSGTGPTSIGTGGFSFANTGSVAKLGIDGFNRVIWVPQGYTSGAALSSNSTYNAKSLASMGLTVGTYTWNWGTGGTADSLIIQVGNVDPTPTPTMTQTPTVTPTMTQTPTVTPTITPSITPSVTATPAVTPTGTPAATPAVTPTPTPSPTIPIFSSNTNYDVCVTCGDNTFIVETEHPVWTNQYGQSVIQMNAVELGGRNGLYS